MWIWSEGEFRSLVFSISLGGVKMFNADIGHAQPYSKHSYDPLGFRLLLIGLHTSSPFVRSFFLISFLQLCSVVYCALLEDSISVAWTNALCRWQTYPFEWESVWNWVLKEKKKKTDIKWVSKTTKCYNRITLLKWVVLWPGLISSLKSIKKRVKSWI